LHVSELVNKFTISEGKSNSTLVSALLYGSGRPEKMRFYGFAVAVGVITLGACAGGEKKPTDTTHVAVDTSASTTTTTTGNTSTTPTGSTGGAVAAAPITGTIKTVNMVGDAKGYRFEPANFTIKQGDGVKFVVVSGGPHNVAFDPATIPADVRAQLDANMGTDKMGELSSSLKMNPGESITVSFGNIKPGQYPYHCVPHLALNMKGVITVQ
jgi:plastocyanin